MKFDYVTPEMAGKISEMLKVLADPMRLRIMQILHQGERCVGDIVEEVGSSQANVSKHLSLLSRVFLVSSEKRGLQVYYKIGDTEVSMICEAICTHYGKLLKRRFAAL